MRKTWSVIAGLLICVVMAACGSNDDSTGDAADSGPSTTPRQIETVRVGDGPYFDFVLFRIAHELGLDKQLGVNLDIKSFTGVPFAQLRRGDLDVIFSSPTAGFPTYENFADYRDFLVTGIFRGNALVGRPGKQEPYEVYLKEAGGDDATAKRNFVRAELPGKRICAVKSQTVATLTGMLKLGGLKSDAISYVDFPDDSKAANAFIQGSGCDYYTGALPQIVRLVTDFKEKAVKVAPYQAFGPRKDGVLFFASYATTAGWLNENPELAKKLVAIWLRTSRYVQEQPEKAVPIAAAAVRDSTGGGLSDEAVKSAIQDFLFFPTFDQAAKDTFNPESPQYFTAAVRDLFNNAKEAGQVQKDASFDQYQVAEGIFKQVQSDPDLVKYIQAPVR